MSNISVHVNREQPQTVTVHHRTSHFDARATEAGALAERRRVIRVLVFLWLIASAQQGAHFFA